MLKTIKLTQLSLFCITVISTNVFAERTSGARSIECLLDVIVTPSQNFQIPVTQYTSIKNDGYPMLLIGIKINHAYAAGSSKNIKTHHLYCLSLIGQQKDAYLSGPYQQSENMIHLGDQLRLKNIHSSGKNYPYWPEFYFLEK
jgi:hypothetical protein